jgi:hypothetical protein
VAQPLEREERFAVSIRQVNLFARTEKRQRDWLATNADDITIQSHLLFACSQEKFVIR